MSFPSWASFTTTLPLFFWAVFFSSLIGTVAYFICRALEKRAPGAYGAGLLFWTLIQLAVVASLLPNWVHIAVYLVVSFACNAVGALAHRRTGGASPNSRGAFYLIFSSVALSMMSSWMPLLMANATYQGLSEAVSDVYWIGILFYPALTPLGLWLLKSLRLWPGIDGHLGA